MVKFYEKKDFLNSQEGLTPFHVVAARGTISLFKKIEENVRNKLRKCYMEDNNPIHLATENRRHLPIILLLHMDAKKYLNTS